MPLLSAITKEAPQLPSRVVLYAPEKSGKTSFGCHAPEPIFLMTAGETGLLSLIESGQVPPTAHFPDDFKTWAELVSAVRALTREDHTYRTLVLDTGNGAEQLLAAAVCAESFEGNWAAYQDFGRGVRLAVPLWASFLGMLDTLRVERKMSIIFLHHAAVKQTANPTGKDWDQHRPEAIDKLWSLTHKWADVIAYYGVKVTVNKDDKATGEQRYLRCSPSAAIVAGNRYGLPDEITSPPGAKHLWEAFAKAMGKSKRKPASEQPKQAEPQPAQHDTEPQPAKGSQPNPVDPRYEVVRQEINRTGQGWEQCMQRCNTLNPGRKVGYDKSTRFGDIESEVLDKLIAELKAMPTKTEQATKTGAA